MESHESGDAEEMKRVVRIEIDPRAPASNVPKKVCAVPSELLTAADKF